MKRPNPPSKNSCRQEFSRNSQLSAKTGKIGKIVINALHTFWWECLSMKIWKANPKEIIVLKTEDYHNYPVDFQPTRNERYQYQIEIIRKVVIAAIRVDIRTKETNPNILWLASSLGKLRFSINMAEIAFRKVQSSWHAQFNLLIYMVSVQMTS